MTSDSAGCGKVRLGLLMTWYPAGQLCEEANTETGGDLAAHRGQCQHLLPSALGHLQSPFLC